MSGSYYSAYRVNSWPNRKFNEHAIFDGRTGFPDIEVSGVFSEDGITCMSRGIRDRLGNCVDYDMDEDSIVIADDGACRNNGPPYARGAIGVFLGQDLDVNKGQYFNISELLDDPMPTNRKAELTAGRCVLDLAVFIKNEIVDNMNQLIIKSDSQYLVKGMTEWIFNWKQNGWRGDTGRPTRNGEIFVDLEGLVSQLNDLGVEVLFWHVPRARNQDADNLANRALNYQ